MSSAKPTPRYVQRVPSPNIHLVGGTAEAQVIPIRRVTPAYVPTIEAPAAPAPRPRRVTRRAPVEQRPWTVMLVPPSPGVRPRAFGIARWQARLAIATVLTSLVFAGGMVAAVVGAFEVPVMFGESEVDLLRDRLDVVEDSLTLARAELATDYEEVGDSLYNVLPGAGGIPMPADAITTPTVAGRLGARTPALKRASRTVTDDGVELGARSIEGLPTVGRLASGFSRSRRHPVLRIRRPHLGVDVAAPKGTPVVAPAPGTISFVGRKFGFGLVVEMDHGGSVRTRYAHLSAAMVKVGDEVAKGAFIAAVGSTGITTGPHLHFEVLVRGKQVDPLRYRLPQAESDAAAAGSAPEHAPVAAPDAGAAEPAAASHETLPAAPAPAPAPR